jgi:hypothetical protein
MVRVKRSCERREENSIREGVYFRIAGSEEKSEFNTGKD